MNLPSHARRDDGHFAIQAEENQKIKSCVKKRRGGIKSGS